MKKSNDTTKEERKNLSNALTRLDELARWFEEREELDVEEGLIKMKEGVALIKLVRVRLKDAENEFEELRASLEEA